MNRKTSSPILLLTQKLATAMLGAALLTPIASPAQTVPVITIWQTASCNCCKQWASDMQSVGFQLAAHTVADTFTQRRQLGIPDELASCQTAQAGPYALEGPVPVADVIDLLRAQPDIIGLVNPTREAPNPKANTSSRTYILHKNGQATPLHPN